VTVFLSAEWRHLAMLSFDVDQRALKPLIPDGTELDEWNGRTFVSLVGFLFLDTRVLGVPVPWHRDFEEVNLRFYVRRRSAEGWRRGVVFVKELVPRRAVALVANIFYGEHYAAVRMSHHIDVHPHGETMRRVAYQWRVGERDQRIEVTARGEAREPADGTLDAFITEHYWGYTRRRAGATWEYRVDHPRWRVWTAHEAYLECDAARLYGAVFADCLAAPPASALLADGSAVTVSTGRRIREPAPA
jgi:uncharacterized protein YqjF (DUF2071 family)